jgi:putative hemolysin
MAIVGVLLVFSALISASEVAYFSLPAKDLNTIRESEETVYKRIAGILEKPQQLLATILVANNMVNVAIVILTTTLLNDLIDFESSPQWLEFIFEVIGVTSLILIVGEVVPKIYANKFSLKVAGIMSQPLLVLKRILWPVTQLLLVSSDFINKRVKKKDSTMTVDELGHALEITLGEGEATQGEKKILEGIVRFGNKDTRQIMKPRMDVVAVSIDTRFYALIAHIIDSGFSRIPVYEGTLDSIKGVLYIKDLIPHLNEEDNFNWQNLIRDAFFVPENKKIDDLLNEFKDAKIHLAIVVDEYGGTQGIVTLEDVIEEIVGEITDEFDDEKIAYSRIDERNLVFEGKTSLIDIYKVIGIEGEEFEKAKGDSDSLAGFLLEQSGHMPAVGEKVKFGPYIFTIEAADKRRIKQVKMTLPAE